MSIKNSIGVIKAWFKNPALDFRYMPKVIDERKVEAILNDPKFKSETNPLVEKLTDKLIEKHPELLGEKDGGRGKELQ
jgi:hypothetical protein